MKGLLAWIIDGTKVGKVLKSIQALLDGKKQLLVGISTAIPATVTILTKYGEQGNAYLVNIASTSEFMAASLGWTAIFNAIKGEKIRAENATIIAQNEELLKK